VHYTRNVLYSSNQFGRSSLEQHLPIQNGGFSVFMILSMTFQIQGQLPEKCVHFILLSFLVLPLRREEYEMFRFYCERKDNVKYNTSTHLGVVQLLKNA